MGYPHFAPTLLWNLSLPSELGVKKPADIFAFSLDDKFLFTLHEDEGGILVSSPHRSPRPVYGFGSTHGK